MKNNSQKFSEGVTISTPKGSAVVVEKGIATQRALLEFVSRHVSFTGVLRRRFQKLSEVLDDDVCPLRGLKKQLC